MGVGTKPQARRVMAAGGEWQEGIMATEADHPQWAERLLDPRDGHCWDFLGEHGGDWLPDLNDAATCAVLWGQAQNHKDVTAYRVEVGQGFDSTEYVRAVFRTSFHDFETRFSGPTAQADALAATFEWLASLEVV